MAERDEHFWEPEPNVIESSAGFSVRVLGRTGMRYQEGDRSVWIDSEVLATPRAIAMFSPSIRVWESPDDPGPVSDAERDRIVANCQRAFAACGYALEVAGPFDWDSVAMRRPEERERKRRAYEAGVSRSDYERGLSADQPDPEDL